MELTAQEQALIDYIRNTGPAQLSAGIHEIFKMALWWGEEDQGFDQKSVIALYQSYELASKLHPLPTISIEQ